jgi:transcriptional regulator with XRE-family HTH domain
MLDWGGGMTKAVSYSQWFLEPYCIGMKLRTLRTQKRLTLARLAAETGLSAALLSKLETDRMIPTLSTLAMISRVYGVGLGYFFSEPSRHSISITRRAHLESESRGIDGPRLTPLAAPSENGGMTAQAIDFPPGGMMNASDYLGNSSGMIYVIEGQLQLDAGGMRELLEPGDCACLHSEMMVMFTAQGKQRCRALAVVQRPCTVQK